MEQEQEQQEEQQQHESREDDDAVIMLALNRISPAVDVYICKIVKLRESGTGRGVTQEKKYALPRQSFCMVGNFDEDRCQCRC